MHDTPPHARAPSPQSVLIWTSQPRGLFETLFGSPRLLLVGIAVVAILVSVIRAPVLPTIYYVIVACFTVIALPVMIVNILPLLRSHARRVSIDDTAQIVYFENVYLHKAFWLPTRMRCFACPFDDVLWVDYSHVGSPEYLVIGTRHGRLMLGTEVNDLGPVYDVLHTMTRGRSVPFVRSQWFMAPVIIAITAFVISVIYKMNWIP